MQQRLQPWLVAVLTRRERLAWTLHPPERPAARMQEDEPLAAFDFWELRRWQTRWLQYLLEAELARLVWLLEAPCVLMARPGWDRWEVARWALATCLARISQLARALEQRQRSAPVSAGLNAAAPGRLAASHCGQRAERGIAASPGRTIRAWGVPPTPPPRLFCASRERSVPRPVRRPPLAAGGTAGAAALQAGFCV